MKIVWIAQSGKALVFIRGPGFESQGQPYPQCFPASTGRDVDSG